MLGRGGREPKVRVVVLQREATSGAKWGRCLALCSALNCLGAARGEPWDLHMCGGHEGRTQRHHSWTEPGITRTCRLSPTSGDVRRFFFSFFFFPNFPPAINSISFVIFFLTLNQLHPTRKTKIFGWITCQRPLTSGSESTLLNSSWTHSCPTIRVSPLRRDFRSSYCCVQIKKFTQVDWWSF